MTEKEFKVFAGVLKYALLDMSLSSLYILISFTQLHIVFIPEENPFIYHEALIIIYCLVFFVVSMRFNLSPVW